MSHCYSKLCSFVPVSLCYCCYSKPLLPFLEQALVPFVTVGLCSLYYNKLLLPVHWVVSTKKDVSLSWRDFVDEIHGTGVLVYFPLILCSQCVTLYSSPHHTVLLVSWDQILPLLAHLICNRLIAIICHSQSPLGCPI